MAVFDPKEMVLMLDGVQLTDFGEKGDAIIVTPGVPAGNYTMGVDGRGTFVNDPDKSCTLVINIKQHSPDNKWLTNELAKQRNAIRSFAPKTLEIRDLLNEDVVSATKGYFTEVPAYARGTNANNTVWTLVFESHTMRLEDGFGN